MKSADGSTASRRAYDALDLAIQMGELKPNQRLIERELVEKLGLSRTPIREAMRQLEMVGLVDIAPNRGAVVRDASFGEIVDIYTVRLTLERLAIDLLTPPTADLLAALERNQRELAAAAAKRDYAVMLRLNDEFHQQLVAPTGNAFLTEQLYQLRRRTYLIRHRRWENQRSMAFVAEHAAIIELRRRADWDGLASVVLRHIFEPVHLYLNHILPVNDTDLAGLRRLEALVEALCRQPRLGG